MLGLYARLGAGQGERRGSRRWVAVAPGIAGMSSPQMGLVVNEPMAGLGLIATTSRLLWRPRSMDHLVPTVGKVWSTEASQIAASISIRREGPRPRASR